MYIVRILLCCLFLGSAWSLQAQDNSANVTIFTENNEAFYLVVNGKNINSAPETNVSTSLQGKQRVKIAFTDNSLMPISTTLKIDPNYTYTYRIVSAGKLASKTNEKLGTNLKVKQEKRLLKLFDKKEK